MGQADAAAFVILTPQRPLHVGQFIGTERESAIEWVPADTLFAALVSAWAGLGRDVATLLAGFHEGDPPFLLTSAFPRAGAVRFYPRPWLRPQVGGAFKGKRLKGLRWVSAKVLHRMAAGVSLADECGGENLLQDDQVWVTRAERAVLPPAVWAEEEQGRIYRYQTVPRVAVDRRESASHLFHSGRVEFAPDCGLWFDLRWRSAEPAWRQRVKESLDYLSAAGLGGLRSSGHGAFAWSMVEEATPAPTTDLAITLSRYAPRDAAELQAALLDDPRTAYRFVTVGGWSHDDHRHTWRRRSVRMVTEGSVLTWSEHAVMGHVVDVTPKHVGAFGRTHRVLRYGYAYPYPVAPAALEEAP